VEDDVEIIVRTILVGVGATIAVDLWALFLNRAFRMPTPNWAMVGRWVGNMPSGKFAHPNMQAAPAVPGEKALGWIVHYVIGIAFATLLVLVFGAGWLRDPTPIPALIVGVVTVVSPYFILQPGMGMGIAGSKTPKPNVVRLRSLLTHFVFGVGLFIAGWLLAQIWPLA
jgi:hypothetical protein